MLTTPESAARDVAMKALACHGLGAEDARVVADSLIEAELRGRPTHGLMRLPGIIKACAELGERPEVVVDAGCIAAIDSHHHLGYVACHMAAQEAIRRARQHGAAWVGVRRTRHMGMMGYYVEMIAREGMVGLAFADCVPLVAPFGGIEKALGTNPIAAAFPWEPHPITVDMGTSATTYGEILLAERAGRPIPEGTAIDREGHPTTDAKAAREGALLPMAGHKGYALAVMAQILSGALTGADGMAHTWNEYGMLIMALRTDILCPADQYRRELAKFIANIKRARRAEGVTEILLPGERSHREREKRLREGIPVPKELWAEITQLA